MNFSSFLCVFKSEFDLIANVCRWFAKVAYFGQSMTYPKKRIFSRFAFDGDDYDDNYNYDYVVVSGGGINIRVCAPRYCNYVPSAGNTKLEI